MKIKWLFIILLFFVFYACKSHPEREKKHETIIVNTQDPKNIMISEFSEAAEIINLNDINIGLISDISVIKTYKEYVVFFDDQLSSLIIYNCNNQQYSVIDKIGRGPGEIMFMADFFIDEIENVIEIMDSGNRKILKYSLDGNFLSEKATGFLGHYFENIDSDKHLIYANYQPNDYNSNLFVVNKTSGNLLKTFLPINKIYEGFSLLHYVHFSRYNNELFFSEMHDNKIFKIENDSISVKYEIDFSTNNIPDQFKKLLTDNPPPLNQMLYLEALSKSDYCNSIHSFFESKQLLGFLFIQNDIQKMFVKSKENKRSIVIDKILLDNGIKLDGNILLLKDDFMYLLMSGLDMTKYKEELLDKLKNPETVNQNFTSPILTKINAICNNATINDNPYIIKIKLKI